MQDREEIKMVLALMAQEIREIESDFRPGLGEAMMRLMVARCTLMWALTGEGSEEGRQFLPMLQRMLTKRARELLRAKEGLGDE